MKQGILRALYELRQKEIDRRKLVRCSPWQQKVTFSTGNRTLVSRVTGGDTNHYTIENLLLWLRLSIKLLKRAGGLASLQNKKKSSIFKYTAHFKTDVCLAACTYGQKFGGAHPRIELGTSCTQSKNHTIRPASHCHCDAEHIGRIFSSQHMFL